MTEDWIWIWVRAGIPQFFTHSNYFYFCFTISGENYKQTGRNACFNLLLTKRRVFDEKNISAK